MLILERQLTSITVRRFLHATSYRDRLRRDGTVRSRMNKTKPFPQERGAVAPLRLGKQCCRLQQTTIISAYNRARKSKPRTIPGVESWSPCGVQTPKNRPVASTGVQIGFL